MMKIQCLKKRLPVFFFREIKIFRKYFYTYIQLFAAFAIVFLMIYSNDCLTTLSSKMVVFNSIAMYFLQPLRHIQEFSVKNEQGINVAKIWKRYEYIVILA